MAKKLSPHSFGSFLKKHGLVPPEMQGKEFEEEEILKEEIESRHNPMLDVADDEDDVSIRFVFIGGGGVFWLFWRLPR